MSWVKYDVSQYGPYLLIDEDIKLKMSLVREDRQACTNSIPVGREATCMTDNS